VHQPTIRKALPADASAISALVLRTVRISNVRDYPADAIEQLVINFASDKVAERMTERDTFVADAGSGIVGTIALGGDRLRTLFVEPTLQGSGLGARLVAHLEAHALAAGVSELKLSSSLTAHGFYERLGYRTVRLEEHDGVSTYLMVKTLA
jgi:N-acetylglutamate synthase-like GNAT family acetyltransferase